MTNQPTSFGSLMNLGMEAPQRSVKHRRDTENLESTVSTEYRDGAPVGVQRVQETAAREFSAYTVSVKAGTWTNILGADQTRSRAVISNASVAPAVVFIGTRNDAASASGYALPAGAVHETEVTDEIFAFAPGSGTDILIGIWVERN